jgi:hypothetical protein
VVPGAAILSLPASRCLASGLAGQVQVLLKQLHCERERHCPDHWSRRDGDPHRGPVVAEIDRRRQPVGTRSADPMCIDRGPNKVDRGVPRLTVTAIWLPVARTPSTLWVPNEVTVAPWACANATTAFTSPRAEAIVDGMPGRRGSGPSGITFRRPPPP